MPEGSPLFALLSTSAGIGRWVFAVASPWRETVKELGSVLTSAVNSGGLISGSDVDAPERMGGNPSQHGEHGNPPPGGLRSAFRRPTLKSLRRRTVRTLEKESSATRVAAAASLLAANKNQPLFLPREVQLSAYWCMDLPLLLPLLLLLGRCCVDATAANGLQLDAPSLVQGLLLVAHVAQVGTDPTCPAPDESQGTSSRSSSSLLFQASRAGSGFPGISLESVALLIAACVWAAGSTASSHSRQLQQQHPQQPPAGQASGSSEPADFPLEAQSSTQSTVLTAAATGAQQHLQQQQLLLLQQLVAGAPTIVQPTRAEVVSSALEVLTDFSGFLKRPSADADAAADEVGWLLGAPQAGADDAPGDATASTAGHDSPAALRAAGHPGTRVPQHSTGAASGGAASPLSGARVAPASIAVGMLPHEYEQRTGGGTSATATDMDAAGGSSLVDLLLRVRGERLAFCLRPCLLQHQDAGDKERRPWTEPIATFSGFLTRRLWLGADWWVIKEADGGDAQQWGEPVSMLFAAPSTIAAMC